MTVASPPITSDPFIKYVVIQDYLNGISRDQTARQRKIAAGSVSNIIKNWKQEMQGCNVEEIRSFSKTVYNSGISVYQCARGYRIQRILNELGVYDEYDIFEDEMEREREMEQEDREGTIAKERDRKRNERVEEEHLYKINQNRGDRNININSSKVIKNNNKFKQKQKEKIHDFAFFVNDIYRNCIKHGISPTIVPYWIEDLMDIFDKSGSRNYSIAAALNRDDILEDNNNNNKENENLYFDCKQGSSSNNNDNIVSPINNSTIYHQLPQQQQQQQQYQQHKQQLQSNSHHNRFI